MQDIWSITLPARFAAGRAYPQNIMVRYAWVSFAILAIWISTLFLMISNRLSIPESFFTFVMITTIILSYIGFRSP